MRKIKNLPKSFQRSLYSYNIRKMDIEKDKEVIITHILNYGTWDDVKLLFRIYPEEDIKKVIKYPRRGVWFEKVLNFWIKMSDIKLNKEVYQKAILTLRPKATR